MEVAGILLGLGGLAGLFSACVDSFDRIQDYRRYASFAEHLVAQYEADKYRFLRWADGVGIEESGLRDDHDDRLDKDDLALAVCRVLSSVRKLVESLNERSSKLASSSDALQFAGQATSANSQNIAGKQEHGVAKIPWARKVGWASGGKTRFTERLDLFGVLVDRLYDLVPLDNKDGVGVSQELIDRFDTILQGKRSIIQNIHEWGCHNSCTAYAVSCTGKLQVQGYQYKSRSLEGCFPPPRPRPLSSATGLLVRSLSARVMTRISCRYIAGPGMSSGTPVTARRYLTTIRIQQVAERLTSTARP